MLIIRILPIRVAVSLQVGLGLVLGFRFGLGYVMVRKAAVSGCTSLTLTLRLLRRGVKAPFGVAIVSIL